MIDIQVLNHKQLFNLSDLEDKSAIIMISDVGASDKKPSICFNKNLKKFIALSFDDVQDNEINCITDDNAISIVRFFKGLHDIKTLIVSCNGGTCRSPAVAAALHNIQGSNDMIIWENGSFVPNETVFRKIMMAEFGQQADFSSLDKKIDTNINEWRKLNDIS